MEDMYERADFAKELGSVIVMIDLTVGYTAIQSMARWARRNGVHPAPAPGRPRHLHPAEDARGELPGDRQVDAAGRGGPHPRRHRGRQAGRRPEHGPRLLRHAAAGARCRPNPVKGLYFDQDWGSMPGAMPVASGGIHAGQMHQLLHYLGEDVVLQFGGGTIGHPMGIAAGATANRVAARGDDQGAQRGPRLLRRGRGHPAGRPPRRSRELDVALATWGDITFNYESTDMPDVVATPASGCDRASRASHADHPGHLLLPARPHRRRDRRPDPVRAGQRLGRCRSSSPTTRTRATSTGRCGGCRCSTWPTRPARCTRCNACRKAISRSTTSGSTPTTRAYGRQTTALSFIVSGPRRSPGSGWTARSPRTARSATRCTPTPPTGHGRALCRCFRTGRGAGRLMAPSPARAARIAWPGRDRRAGGSPSLPSPRRAAGRQGRPGRRSRRGRIAAVLRGSTRNWSGWRRSRTGSGRSPHCCSSTGRGRFGLATSRPSLHMCFTGSPGTGKTTVALRMADLLKGWATCARGHLVSGDPRRPGRPVRRAHRAEDQGGAQARDGRGAVHRRGLLPVPAGERAGLRPGVHRDPAAGDGEPARGPRGHPGRLRRPDGRLLRSPTRA